jgi:sugar lactone lactonase YvrE
MARAVQQPPQFPPGTLLTVAGIGKAGFSGDGGPATQAALNNPYFLAVDAAGNLFIGDAYNDRVRRVRSDGTIATVAGGGQLRGSAGDGGPATQVNLEEVPSVAVDTAGDLFLGHGDGTGNALVRKVDTAGIITTVAGGGHPADGLGDGGSATAAKLRGAAALASDSAGDLFISDDEGQRVRKVDTAGIITTVAGGGHPADGRGDGGLATDAHLRLPVGLALDPAGNLYIADAADNRVRRVSRDGKISTVAGGGQPADGLGDGGPAAEAHLDGEQGIAVDRGGNLFITENHGERIRKVNSAGIITTVAGTGQVGDTGDGGPATAARLNSPLGACLDRAGNLFFAEGNRYTMDPNGNLIDRNTQANHLVREVVGVAVPQ